ncbi:MAG: POTRA domain-containing protein, partial [Candidatus Cryptobacteroides sp.]
MRKSRIKSVLPLIAVLLAVSSCSTTRVLRDGEFSLAGAKVSVTNDKNFKESELTPYIQQKPNNNFLFGWNPFVSVYNWSNGKGGPWDRFVQKLGTAPIIYEPSLVDESISNISRHLEYLGYYASDVDSEIKVKKKKVYVNYNSFSDSGRVKM